MRRKTTLALSLGLLLCACASMGTDKVEQADAPMAAVADEGAIAAKRLAQLVDAHFEESLKLDPFHAPFYGDYRYNDRFGNELSDDYLARQKAVDERYLSEVRQLDRAALSPHDQLTYDTFVWNGERALEALRFPEPLLPFNQFYSRVSSFVQFGSGESAQPFATVKDYDDFRKKAAGFPVWVDAAIARFREGKSKGVVLPRILVQRLLPQLSEHIVADPRKSLFWAPIARMPAEFSEAERLWLGESYAQAIGNEIVPAFRRLHDFLKKDYLPAARATAGYGSLPDGAAWYAYYAKLHTTTELSPEQIHRIGLAEVARILGEMEQVRVQVGFQGDLKAFFQHLATDDRFYFRSGNELVAGYQDLKARINGILPRFFDLMPRTDYEVRPVEAFRAASAAGASYEAGSPDGKRPGVFYINTHNLRAQPKFGMETLSLHEAAPGHHFQISLQQEMDSLPKFRRFGGYTAFDEGWALYAESLGKEMGLFTDPYQYYGRLSDEMLRAMRLVVDTGLHYKGWSREQAVRYMLDNSSMAESDVVAEVERYMAIPGQALSYKIGQLKLTELRRYAEAELGAKFDVKAFHNQVLGSGALPMAVLEGKIKAWVAATKAH